MKTKYILSLLIPILFTQISVAQEVVELDFGDDIIGMPGDTVEIQVTADLKSYESDSYSFEFLYDTTLISLSEDDVYRGAEVSGIFQANEPEQGRIKFGVYGGTVSGDLVLFTIEGILKGNGTASDGLSFSLIDLGYDGSTKLPTNVTAPYNISLTVADEIPNQKPEFQGALPDTAIKAGATLEYTYTAEDPEGDTINFSLGEGTPEAATIDAETGAFSWATTEQGIYEITAIASDGELSDSTFTTVIVEENTAPEFTIILPDTSIEAGTTLEFTYEAEDMDDDELSFTLAADAPQDATINAETGVLSWTASEAGTFELTTIVSDGAFSDSTTATVTVSIVNTAPEFTTALPDTTIEEGENLEFTYVAEDAEDDDITYSLGEETPEGATIDVTSGLFSWEAALGEFTIAIIASDGTLSDTTHAAITVTEANEAPVFTSVLTEDATITEDELFEFTYEASDAEGDELSFSLVEGPEGATIDAESGLFSWTPSETAGDEDGEYTITVEVTDGSETTSTSVTVTVADTVSNEFENTPNRFALNQNYPNPFNPTTNITYQVAEPSAVRLDVFNALGQKVTTLVNEQKGAGSYTVTFDANNLTSGIYLMQLKAGNFTQTRKMLLMK